MRKRQLRSTRKEDKGYNQAQPIWKMRKEKINRKIMSNKNDEKKQNRCLSDKDNRKR